jgi:hypothetical protein
MRRGSPCETIPCACCDSGNIGRDSGNIPAKIFRVRYDDGHYEEGLVLTDNSVRLL